VLEKYKNRVFSTYYTSAIIIEPPCKIKRSYYCCDSKFHLDDIATMFTESIKYGLILISGRECLCYIIEQRDALSSTDAEDHFDYKLIDKVSGFVDQKQGKGGQSAPRIGRIRLGQKLDLVKRMVGVTIRSFYESKIECKVEGLIVGGISEMKKEVMKNDSFMKFFGTKAISKCPIMAVETIGMIDSKSPINIINKYKHMLTGKLAKDEMEFMSEFNELLISNVDVLTFGIDEIRIALDDYMLQKVYISKELDEKIINEFVEKAEIYGCKYIIGFHKDYKTIGIKFY
jgi:peptide subunit release factor 1 (eRF1)